MECDTFRGVLQTGMEYPALVDHLRGAAEGSGFELHLLPQANARLAAQLLRAWARKAGTYGAPLNGSAVQP